MTPSAWIALATFLLIQTATIAFALGRLFQRVSAVEKTNDALAGLATSMARIEVHVAHQSASIDDLKDKMAWVTAVAPAVPVAPSRSRPK
jgi:hypothetical protein